MGYEVKNFLGHFDKSLNNPNLRIIQSLGAFNVVEYDKDLSVSPKTAQQEYFMSLMNVHRRQLICTLEDSGVILQAGAMQWMIGNCKMTTGVKGVGDYIGKALRGKVTKESIVKPEYTGDGIVACEPTYKHLILTEVSEWNGGLVVDDGMFMGSEISVVHDLERRSNFSSALAGGKGLFNLKMTGKGVACLESKYPKEELMELEIQDDVIKIDGPLAVCWSGSLQFTVERTTETLVGSAASGEGLVNVYRGTGKLWMIPVG